MSTPRTIMFSWFPACLEQSALPTFLCCCNCAHEPCSSGQGWCEEQLGESAGSGHTRSRRSDKGRSHSRSRSPRRAVPLHAAWKRDTVLSRAVGRSPRSAEVPEGGVPCDRDHDAHRNHVRDLLLPNKISGLEAFNASVAAQASGARGVADVAVAGHYGKWKGNLARDVRRAFLKYVDKPNVCWARVPCKDLATGAAKTPTWCPFLLVHEMLASLVEKHAGGRELFHSNSTAPLEYEAQLLRQPRHE